MRIPKKHNTTCSVIPLDKKLLGGMSNISQLKLRIFSWPLLFLGAFVLLILLTIVPWKNLIKSLWANSEDIETISFYASGVNTDKAGENYDEGWWQTTKAQLNPDLASDASLIDFSDQNSAFYAGGKYSLVFSAFNFLKEEVPFETPEEIDPWDEAMQAENSEDIPEVDNSGEVIVDDSKEDFLNEELVVPIQLDSESQNESDVIIENETNKLEVDTETPETVEEFFDNDGDSSSDAKVSSPPQLPTNSESESSREIKPVSVLNNIFGSTEAIAQEYLTSKVEKFEDLGEFKSAKIKLSLAFGAVSSIKNEDENESIKNEDEAIQNENESIQNKDEELRIKNDGVDTSSDNFPAADTIDQMIAPSEDLKVETLPPGESDPEVEVVPTEDNAEPVKVPTDEAKPTSRAGAIFSLIKAAQAQVENASGTKLVLWYSLDEGAMATTSPDNAQLWQQFDTLGQDSFSNALNSDYLSYEADFLKSWADIENLKIKIEAVDGDELKFVAYIDSVWVEVDYDPETELEKIEKRQRFEEALKLISEQTVFEVFEDGTFVFAYEKNERRIWDTLSEMLGVGDFWKDVSIYVDLFSSDGEKMDIPMSVIFNSDGEMNITIDREGKSIMPGKYSLRFHIEDNSGEVPEIFDITKDFYWGVLVMNTNKDIYLAGDSAFVQMAVLDEGGHTVCNAKLELNVKGPNGEEVYKNFGEGENAIKLSDACGPDTVTDQPDYSVFVPLRAEGEYEMTLKATTASGEKSISRSLVVGESDFSIERISATRIYPKSDYDMHIKIEANKDFYGDIKEVLPAGFKYKHLDLKIINKNTSLVMDGTYLFSEERGPNDEVELIWHEVSLSPIDILEINYTYDAPDKSPETFLAGPMVLSQNSEAVYSEKRSWQIASDALLKRARTVMFQAGVYNGAATAGQNTNTDYKLAAFNWRLAETGVSIKNAYIVMETQFEAYNTIGGTYAGYKLGFDACVENCSSDAFGVGSGQVLSDNANALVYDEGESNTGRLLLDVSSEAQLAAYTGDSVLMESQFGYRLKNSSAYSSIANLSAMLIVTYTYDLEAPSITNTVVYPVDSTTGTNNGSTKTGITTHCTADNNCPTFAYNMNIPEWPGTSTSTNRVSQFFRMDSHPYNNTIFDIEPYLDIETYNVDSSRFHYESALSSNGNMPPMYFPTWANSGYAENQDQQTEFYMGGATTTYAIGGEVTETYIASSSAPLKTRTVSFPVGVINNGNNMVLNSKDISVFFPENGNATGTVDIKSAWLRLRVHGAIITNAYTVTVSTKAGNSATSTPQAYAYRANSAIVKPTLNLYHIIPETDYAELEEATANSGKTLRINSTYSNGNFSVASAELMITYTYSSEANGYATSLSLFGGQMTAAAATSTTLATANSVFPEQNNKTVLAGGLFASFMNSDTTRAVGNTVRLMGVNLSTTIPSCTTSYRALPDSQNMHTEMIAEVSSLINTTDNQSYNACYAIDDTTVATDVASMNGQLVYTYGWTNTPPTGTFNSASFRIDGSGVIDLEAEVDDLDDQDCQAKLEYATGTTCIFSSPSKATIDETDANITALYQDPWASNANTYQLGTANGYITTASGSNAVAFDWKSKSDLVELDGDYCLRITASDRLLDQATPATTTIYIDNKKPSAPEALSLHSRTGSELVLNYGATSTETNFKEYKIFYKVYDGTDPTEASAVISSSTDSNLGDKYFSNQATTSISGLNINVIYSIAIWAYDYYGNVSSSSRVDIFTNDAPISSFNNPILQKNDGSGAVDISIEADDLNNNDTLKAKVVFATGTSCSFVTPATPLLDENGASIQVDFGSITISNANPYQVGASSAWILTSPGSNTVQFDWLSKNNLPSADGDYCLGVIVNDSYDDQLATSTTIVTIDNVKPFSTGNLLTGELDESQITLIYNTASPATDTHEPASNAYKIFYTQGTTGVSEANTEVDRSDLDAYNYKSATSTVVNGLSQNTWYVFNIWSYDDYGNATSANEIAIKTDANITNKALTFVNPAEGGYIHNIAAAGTGIWTFRVLVKEVSGYYAIASTTLRLANENDNISPYNDFAFSWDQSSNVFSEIGADVNSLVTLSPTSVSNCAGDFCTLDFDLIFSKKIISSSVEFNAELFSGNDSLTVDHDVYPNFYQVRVPYLEQMHYRWRNDNGGE